EDRTCADRRRALGWGLVKTGEGGLEGQKFCVLGPERGQDRRGIGAFCQIFEELGAVDRLMLDVEIVRDRLRLDAAIMEMVGIAEDGGREGGFKPGESGGIPAVGARKINVCSEIV